MIHDIYSCNIFLCFHAIWSRHGGDAIQRGFHPWTLKPHSPGHVTIVLNRLLIILRSITQESGDQASTSNEETGSETHSLVDELGRLNISCGRGSDESFLSPDTGSASSTSDEAPTAADISRGKLNTYLVSQNIAPLPRQSWMPWDLASTRTKVRYTNRTAEIVSSVLSTLSPNDAGSLWKALVSSRAVEKVLDLDELSPTQTKHLQALAEAYNQAQSWQNRREILSIMAGVASYQTISVVIQGLTRYRYTLANLHRLQHGPSAPIPHHSFPRIRIDRRQLDHFLDFITSPHLVQDLPFGQKALKLSSGEILEIPNVIRTMIPQRIARQYMQYCSETGFKPFSEATMLRVLSECKASVRKSLQGLDYYAADGARAFDDLGSVVRQLGELGLGKEWEVQHQELLKTVKSYLKGDFKVKIAISVSLASGIFVKTSYYCIIFYILYYIPLILLISENALFMALWILV